MPLSARQEALLDLLIEQTVGPYLGTAIQMAFLLGVGAGLPAEAMVLEMYMSGEMARTFQAFAEAGFMESVGWHGEIAQYGGFIRTLEVDRESMHRMFGAVLEDIRSGGFARRFQEEHAAGHPTLAAIDAVKAAGSPMTDAERRVRAALGR
jgi:ketol-acid reductoisomerase